jgi:hypothetical protein
VPGLAAFPVHDTAILTVPMSVPLNSSMRCRFCYTP